MSITRILIFYTLILPIVFFLTAGTALALTVNDLRLGVHSDKTRLVVDLDQASQFRTFVLPDPWRLVIDLPAFNWQTGNISIPPESGIKDIRQGALQPDISRIVVDLTHPAIINNAFILRKDQGRPDRLVIDFKRSSAAQFAQQDKKVHGILNVDSPPEATTAAPAPPPAQQATPQETAGTAAVPARKPGSTPPPAARSTARKPVIVIDPGHGGIDPGAVGANGVFEKHVVLATARELKRQLESTGRYEVRLTRNNDTFLKLHQRVEFARRHNADLFISLHADSIGKPNVRGASVYTLSETASDTQTARLAERENRADLIAGVDLSHEDDQVANILIGLAMRDTMNQSNFVAGTIVDSLRRNNIRVLETPQRSAGFAVLRAADIPSILVEIGFMSNRQEASQLARPEYQSQVSRALTDAIESYFEKVRQNQRI